MEYNEFFVEAFKALSAGLCMGIGAIGPAIGEGNAVAKAKGKDGKAALNVRSPKLWGIDNPYLYRMELTLKSNGKVIDETGFNVGIRTVKFDPDKGFSLNGESMKIKGVCIHHDA